MGKVMVDSMNVMGYDALTLGRMDLNIGLVAAQERQQEAEFAFLSANLVDLETLEPLFEPYTIIERDGHKIGIIGFSEPEVVQSPGVRDVATWVDPNTIVADLVAEVKTQADVIIVLSHLGIENDYALAELAPDINVIIGGLTRKLMEEPDRVGDTLIIQCGNRGEWLGKLDVTLDAYRKPEEATATLLILDDKYQDNKEISDIVAMYAQLHPSPTPMPTRTLTPTPEG